MSNPKFFFPTEPFDLNAELSITAEGDRWCLQTVNPTKTKQRASGLCRDGDETAWQAYGTQQSVSAVYKCYAPTGNLKVPSVGLIANGWHVDSSTVAYSQTDWPTITLAMHKHDDGASHTKDSCRTYSPGLKMPAQFGVPELISDTTSVAQLKLNNPAIGMRSLSYALSATHIDENRSNGNWLAGENHDGVETLDAEFTGAPDDTDLTVAAGWHRSSEGTTEGNTAVDTKTLSLVRHIGRDKPPTP